MIRGFFRLVGLLLLAGGFVWLTFVFALLAAFVAVKLAGAFATCPPAPCQPP